jgi:hypothetical protein
MARTTKRLVKSVSCSFKITGAVEEVDIYIGQIHVPVRQGKGKFDKQVSDDKPLKITIELSGDNGAEYSVEYSITSDGIKKEDASKPSPLSGKIKSNGYKEETLTIQL